MGAEGMGLQAELDAFRAEWARKAPEEAQALIAARIADQRAAEARILPEGAVLPDIVLPDATGAPRRLHDLAPAVIVFYRGGWCPYCNLQLRAWQTRLPDLAARGARLVAISPQAPDGTLSTVERNALGFPVLSDSEDVAGAAFGVSHALPEDLVALYRRFGHALEVVNGRAGWRLPMPATFVVGPDRRIAFAQAEADYRRRVEPDAALAALDRLAVPA
ncbi:peroxiredoxin-like family protein [Falsiroseomonas oryzae]|uniref:peroxiredoxin-like family protein n=1 Tax=Falsiroseomonas oryzae TaxID=2766473 RepID=UPI0022EA8E14|nr:peroxiredoxin-like family protein [Roseomonas sp. MO-31]